MKERLLNIAFPIVMVWLIVMPLSAQGVAFGIKGGLEVVNMEFRDDVFDKSNRAGYFIGPTFVFSTGVPGLCVDISGLYRKRSLKVDGESIDQQSVTIPAHARYGASIVNFGGVFLCAGPQLSFNVGPSKHIWEDIENNAKQFILQDTKLAIDFGLGVTIGHHLEAILYYSVPIGKTADFSWNEVEGAVKQVPVTSLNTTKSHANSWLLSFGYIF